MRSLASRRTGSTQCGTTAARQNVWTPWISSPSGGSGSSSATPRLSSRTPWRGGSPERYSDSKRRLHSSRERKVRIQTLYLNHKNTFLVLVAPFSDLVSKAECKTGLEPKVLVTGLVVTLALWLAMGFAAQLLAGVIGYVYPAYQTVR